MTDEQNAKNKLADLIKSLGHQDNEITKYQCETVNPARATLVVTFPHGLTLEGTGKASRKTEAEIIASQEVINQLYKYHPELVVDWDELMVEAQRGDALIKLGVYLSEDFKRPSDKSFELQKMETNERLANVYDRWIADKDGVKHGI